MNSNIPLSVIFERPIDSHKIKVKHLEKILGETLPTNNSSASTKVNLAGHNGKSDKTTDPCKRKEAKTQELSFAQNYLFLPIVFLATVIF